MVKDNIKTLSYLCPWPRCQSVKLNFINKHPVWFALCDCNFFAVDNCICYFAIFIIVGAVKLTTLKIFNIQKASNVLHTTVVSMTKVPSVIHWFRLDLRIHDNLALRNAINEVCFEINFYILSMLMFHLSQVLSFETNFLLISGRESKTSLKTNIFYRS